MDLSLTEEQRMLADSVRSVFGGADDDPTAGGEAPEGGLEFRAGLWRQGAELGLTALLIDDEHDGAGAGIGEAWAATNALGALCAPEPLVDAAYVPSLLVAALGTAEQQDALLPGIASGEALVPLAHAETGTGWDGERSATVTGGALTGTKRAVAAPDVAASFLVTAVEDGVPGVYVVDRAAEGVTVEVHRDAEWVRTATVNFDGAAAERLGGTGPDATTVTAALDRTIAVARILQGGRAVGLMETAVNTTVEYLKVRKQFGVTLNRFQALTHRAAQVFAELESARSLALWATATAAAAIEDGDDALLVQTARDAHAFLTRQAQVVAEEAVQLHGGIGVTYETAVSHYAAALTGFRQIYGGELENRGAVLASGSPQVAPSALLDNALI
jgi:alkylation response protein AidB-like acyl-CoA dehydrogenase